jgi:antitoxin (DNA-binding transcriptional repressor) of toxin-antitoxin stability system
VIARAGKPVAMLTPLRSQVTAKRKLGRLSGSAVTPSDFDAPLPEGVLDAFEGS